MTTSSSSTASSSASAFAKAASRPARVGGRRALLALGRPLVGAGGELVPDGVDGAGELVLADAELLDKTGRVEAQAASGMAAGTTVAAGSAAPVAVGRARRGRSGLVRRLGGQGRGGGRRRRPPDVEDVVSTLAANVIEAWCGRGLEGMARSPFGEAPAPVLAGIVSIELLVHACDLVRATGARLTVSDELVEYVATLAVEVVPGARGRAFGEEVVAPEGVDALTRMVAYTGRVVSAA